MNQAPLTITIQDLENLLNKNSCNCHFINPNKTRVILWKERNDNSDPSRKEEKNGSTTYYLRIGIQKFISYPLTDKNGEIYWRFNGYETRSIENTSVAVGQREKGIDETAPIMEKKLPDKDFLDPITKFQQRQIKTENYDKSINSSQQSEPVSH